MILSDNNQQLIMVNNQTAPRGQIKPALIIPSFAILMACFYPTSANGVIFDTRSIIWYYIVSSLMVVIVFFINKRNVKLMYILIALVVYLEIVTLFCTNITGAAFSIARFVPVFLCLMLFTVEVKEIVSFHILKALLEVITMIIVLWNVGLISQIQPIIDYTVDNYSQFTFFTVSSMIGDMKPIFTFGAHTFASFFYMLIFYLWYLTIKNGSKSKLRYYLYLVSFMVFTILLKSSASLMFSILMFILIIKLSKSTSSRIAIAILVIIAAVLLFNTELYNIYRTAVTSSNNGIIPRYLSGENVFISNFEVLKKVILGIGYTIPRNYAITYTDSGYIVYFTMGNIILPIGLYYMLHQFLKNNTGKHAKGLFFIVLLFELVIPSIIYIKTSSFLIFIIYYLKSLYESMNTGSEESK